MKAIRLTERGIEGVRYSELDSPALGSGQVRLRMLSASVNRVDLYMRDNGAGIRHTLPQTLGVDGVGEVLETAADVDMPVGQRVVLYPYQYCGSCRYCNAGDQTLCLSAKIFGEHLDGTFTEEMVVPARSLMPVSATANPHEVATLGVAYLTAWRMVFGKAPLTPGQVVLVQGAGGGVSYAAMQLAMMAGAKVIVTTSGQQKIQHFAGLGIDVIDYANDDVVAAVLDITNGEGADRVIDNSGEKSWPSSLRALTRGGEVITCGATTGGNPSAELQRVFIRQLSVRGSTMGSLEEFRRLLKCYEYGLFKPRIDSVFSLPDVAEAFNRQESPERLGKVVISISE
ncbi:MAG: zinc-binding dehydrogenase [Thiolinea sp.]